MRMLIRASFITFIAAGAASCTLGPDYKRPIVHTPAGEYLGSLRNRFPGPTVADMLCLLEIRLELAMRVKGLLLARAAGLEVPADALVLANLEELRFLERSIGPTGRLAMRPLLPEGRERWQIRLLEGQRPGGAKSPPAG